MNILNLAYDGKYNEFATEVKADLKSRLANHETIQNYISVMERIHSNKEAFKSITNRDKD